MTLPPESFPTSSAYPHDFGITIQERYVLVEVKEVPDLRVAQLFCRAIDQALTRSRLRAVIFDSRVTSSPSQEVNRAIWAWCRAGKHHDVIAIVVSSELLKVSGNMTALSEGVRSRSVGTVHEAAAFIARVQGQEYRRV